MHKVQQDQRVLQAQQELMVQMAHKDQRVQQERLVHKVQQAQRVLQEQQEI